VSTPGATRGPIQARPRDGAAAPVTQLLYLHGFRSSPRSFKAQRMQAWMQRHRPDVHWWCPQLPPSPHEAVELLERGTAAWPREGMAVVGSSLGGFYATVLAEHLGCRAAVINPAVLPARDLARYIGEQTSFHDPQDRFFFRPEFIGELEALAPHPITRPERYWALIAKGDEVLNWQEMVAHYPGVALTLLEGSDHAVSDFGQHMPGLLRWLGLD
jgi:hypothetical protein